MLIDAHAHMWHRDMLPDKAVSNYMDPLREFKEKYGDLFDFHLDDAVPFADYDEKIELTIEVLNNNHFDYMVVLGTDFELVNEGRMSNDEYMDWLYERCSIDDRFIPFISVDPNKRDAPQIMERYVRKYNPKGIKVYPATGFYPDQERYDAFWDTADDLGLLVVTHAGMGLPPLDEKFCHPRFFERIAERHPDSNYIIAHLGGKFHDELFPLMEKCDNIYSDCSALQGWIWDDPSMIDRRLEEAMGRFPERIVFGTDFPLYEYNMAASRFLDIIHKGKWGTEKSKADLLGNTMARLLGL